MKLAIGEYFDLASRYRRRQVSTDGGQKFPVFPQYAAMLAGIVVQPFFSRFQVTGIWDLKGFVAWLIAAVIIGICIFPSVYKSALDPTRPLFVQLCLVFTAGMGWQSLFQTAMKAATAVASSTGGTAPA